METNETSLTWHFPLSISLFYSVPAHQNCCLSPVRPSLTPCRQSSGKKTDGKCVSLKCGKEKLNATFTNSAPSSSYRHALSSSSCARSPWKNKKERKHTSPRVSVDTGYQQPTVSSTTRALSPYTHRKMCQLSEDARQRLSHLQLGPHHFRKEIESQPPFLVSNITYIPLNWRQWIKKW